MKDISTKSRRNTDIKHFLSFNTMQITETCLEFELKEFFCVSMRSHRTREQGRIIQWALWARAQGPKRGEEKKKVLSVFILSANSEHVGKRLQ